MIHKRTRFVISLAGAVGFAVLAPGTAEESQLEDPRPLAEKVLLVAGPTEAFRYNQGTGPYGPSTKTLLERGRRAFFPGETVDLSFRLPDDARLGTPAEVRVALALHDLDGVELAAAGETTLRASDQGVEGGLTWLVPDVSEGRYFLAARFVGPEGTLLLTRSEVVFLAPEYPRLLATAEDALERLRAGADTLDATQREVSLPSTEMLVEDAVMRWEDFARAPRDWDYIRTQLETAVEFANRLASGDDPWRHRRGPFIRAYRSDIDNTLQPYALYVPESYDPAETYPMLVMLHGATSNHLLARRRVFGLGNRPGESDYEAIRNDVDYPDLGFIVLAPYARGEVAGYSGTAEGDVLRAMADAERTYNVDPDRVHLTGLSMGGGGTWHFGLRFPDRFASISPVCAVGDVELFPSLASATAADRELLTLTSPSAIAENALNQQVFIFHGDEDPAVGVEHSRRMVEIYRKLGWLDDSVFYFELPGVHHFAWDFSYRDASLFSRIEDIRRDAHPERVVYSTFSPRYRQAYWTRIDRIDRGLRMVRIEATRDDEGLFQITTENLSAFSLLLSPEIAPVGKRIEVRVDGRRVYRGKPKNEVLSFARRGRSRWKATKPWRGPAQGPPDHAEAGLRAGGLVQYGPHVYVYGTAGDDATTAALKQVAERLADWGSNVRARWTVLPDTGVTSELMATHNLVLVGRASANAIVGQIEAQLPVRQDSEGTHVGARRVAGPGAAFRVQAPNPLSPGRLVLVYGGSPEAMARFLPGSASRRPSLGGEYIVVDADGQPALQGYFRDDYTIAGTDE
jgi:pimeloyl-ACP methyl ester carboxylesterase